MSLTQISRSADLQRLVDDGYELEIKGGYLLLKHVPYVSAGRTIKIGTLVSELTLAGDVTTTPTNHVVMFAGDMPCDQRGNAITQIQNASGRQQLADGLAVDHSFSSKPPGGYADYYQKMTTYEGIISAPAQALDPHVTAKTFAVLEPYEEDSVFRYVDTASVRAGIAAVTAKLKIGPVAIVGLGGTGSYIMDLLAKTPVSEIHLFDGDKLGQHNAFRAPGAPSISTLRTAPLKSEYYRDIYNNMRRNIFAHGYVDESTEDCLRQMSFVFVAVDRGDQRKLVVNKLEANHVPFIDAGMDIQEVDGFLHGQLRVTASTDLSRDTVHQTLPLAAIDGHDEYSQNIQTADLNALCASLAVIKWKKLLGFYGDLEGEHSNLYVIEGSRLINEDKG